MEKAKALLIAVGTRKQFCLVESSTIRNIKLKLAFILVMGPDKRSYILFEGRTAADVFQIEKIMMSGRYPVMKIGG